VKVVHGIHHITAIAGPPQENADFYAGILGMRLVKRSINQDDPGTYHLFYADAEGHPGTDLTFFPWMEAAPPQMGHGLAVEVQLEVPPDSLAWWGARLERYGFRTGAMESRFGDRAMPFVDPHGMRVSLVETARSISRISTPWDGSPVPQPRQIRGLYGAQLWERDAARTTAFMTRALGFEELGREDGWVRYGFRAHPGIVDIRETPGEPRGAWGVGAVHHLAWAVADDEEQLRVRDQVGDAGGRATGVIDRFWFKSVYFKEPGGVLFEIATVGPGFAVDESPAHLGESLVLPPWYEPSRAEIERVLPPLTIRYPDDGHDGTLT